MNKSNAVRVSNVIGVSLALITLAACGTTSQERYAKLTNKRADECSQNLNSISQKPATILPIGKDVADELDDKNCFTAPNGSRGSFQVYEFTPSATTHLVEILTYIKPRGFGFGGENTIAVPNISVFQGGSPAIVLVKQTEFKWITTFIDGSILKSAFQIGNLDAGKAYRLVVASDNRNLGKEIPGYYTTPAAGIVVIGPFGKTKITLK